MVVDGPGVAFDGVGVMVEDVGVMVGGVGVMVGGVGVTGDGVEVMIDGVGVTVEGGVIVDGVGVMVDSTACWGRRFPAEAPEGIQDNLAGTDATWSLLAASARGSRTQRPPSSTTRRSICFINTSRFMRNVSMSIV